MYIGHYAAALGAKKAAPGVSLGTLFIAAMFTDLLMSVLLIIGIEHIRIAPGITAMVPLDLYDYPFSHGLITSLAWSVIFGAAYYVIKRSLPNALVVGSVVFSHWLLDFVTHMPDLPLFPGSDIKLGLGLWNSVGASIIVESLLFLAGLFMYLRSTKAKDKTGTIALWALVIFLSGTWVAGMISPPPPNPMVLAFGTQMQWIVVLMAYWINRHREMRTAV